MKTAAKALSSLGLAIIGGLLTQLILNWIPPTREAVETYVSSVDALSGVHEGSREAGYVYLFLPLIFTFLPPLVAVSYWLDPDESFNWGGFHGFFMTVFILAGLVGVQNTVQGLIAPENPKWCVAWYCWEMSEWPRYSPPELGESLSLPKLEPVQTGWVEGSAN